MKKQRTLSFLLSIVMIITFIAIPAYAEETQSITAYVTMSKHGKITQDKNGNTMALIPIELTGKSSYTLDDVFISMHDDYYEGGAESGYASGASDWGTSITKLWGDESGNFGYQLNGGTETIMGPSHEIEDGDYVDAILYNSYYPDTEAYTIFNAYTAEVAVGENLELILSEVTGYDAAWNMIFSACADAEITINNETSGTTTDTDGKAVLTFDTEGTYIVSASKNKTLNEESVPAITAPVCVVEVTATTEPESTESIPTDAAPTAPDPTDDVPVEADSITIMHNIAEKYSKSGISTDGNMIWFIADMATYANLYPESEFILSEEEKQICLDKIITDVASTTAPAALAKDIIALRALGYDAKNIYTADSQHIDAVEKLTALVDENTSALSNIYTLPYIITALQQNADYATEEQINLLINTAISNKESWQSTTWGIDGATPMMIALAPYYNTNEAVKNAIDETIPIITALQDETGLISNASSTGLAIAAFSALGIDPKTIVTNDRSLVDGLMTTVADDLTGFMPTENSFSTEQGFRGLLALKLLEHNTRIYDFSSYSMNIAQATLATPIPTNKPTQGGSSSSNDITVTVKVMIHDKDKCDNSYTYKNNSSKFTALVNEAVALDKGTTVYEALVKVLEKNDINFSTDNNGYILSIDEFAEFDHGNKSGWMFTVNGQHKNTGSYETKLNSDSTVVWFYTDNYTREKGSENYSSGGSGNSSVNTQTEKSENVTPTPDGVTHTFTDVESGSWYEEAVLYATEHKLFDGVSDTEFAPNANITRAMLITVLYRLENAEKPNSKITFTDVSSDAWYYDAVLWAAENNIVTGITNTAFAPDDNITREQMATILYRYAIFKSYYNTDTNAVNSFEDIDCISDWAYDAVIWANANGLINGVTDTTFAPKDTAERAQAAMILMRFCENNAVFRKDKI